jgi:hypothetical protein
METDSSDAIVEIENSRRSRSSTPGAARALSPAFGEPRERRGPSSNWRTSRAKT